MAADPIRLSDGSHSFVYPGIGRPEAIPEEHRHFLSPTAGDVIRSRGAWFVDRATHTDRPWLATLLSECGQGEMAVEIHLLPDDSAAEVWFRFPETGIGLQLTDDHLAAELDHDWPDELKHVYSVIGAIALGETSEAGGLVNWQRLEPITVSQFDAPLWAVLVSSDAARLCFPEGKDIALWCRGGEVVSEPLDWQDALEDAMQRALSGEPMWPESL